MLYCVQKSCDFNSWRSGMNIGWSNAVLFYRCWIWFNRMSLFECPSMYLMSSIHLQQLGAGNILTCNLSWGSLLCMILPFYGKTALEVHQKQNYKVNYKCFLFFSFPESFYLKRLVWKTGYLQDVKTQPLRHN